MEGSFVELRLCLWQWPLPWPCVSPPPLRGFPPRIQPPSSANCLPHKLCLQTDSLDNRRHGIPSAAGHSSSQGVPRLTQICNTLELCFFEVCIRNLGRPAGSALHGFVFAVVEAFTDGYTREQLSLELAFGSARMDEFEIGTAGCRLTSTEEHYRSKWLETIYITLHMLNVKNDNASSSLSIASDAQLYSTVRHVLDGQISGDEQSFINFDRGLATKGASGGLVAKNVVISPQLVPVSQLVLLTLKVFNEMK